MITNGDNQIHNNNATVAPTHGASQPDPARKPKSESVLKNLPEEFQLKIYKTCKLPTDKGGGYLNVAQWLREQFKTVLDNFSRAYYRDNPGKAPTYTHFSVSAFQDFSLFLQPETQ